MSRGRVIPCLLLKGQGLVKTVKFDSPRYVGDPINAIRIFNEKEVDELMLLDITATVEGRGPAYDTIRNIASECFMPLAYGGGVRTLDDVTSILNIGVEKVVINSAALTNPALITAAARVAGSQAIVVSVDVRRRALTGYEVVARRGAKGVGMNPTEFAKRIEEIGAGEILLTSVDRDGTGLGYDLELIKCVTSAVSIPVIACGGAGSLEHLRQGFQIGRAAAVAAGSMFVFTGKHRAVLITYPSRAELSRLNVIP